MEVRIRSVKGRQFWRTSGSHLTIITVALQLPFFGNGFRSKTLRKNPELESIRQFVIVLNLILATPATSLVPNCNGPAVPLDPSLMWRGGGMLHGQQPAPHITLPRLTSNQSPTPTSTPGEDTPASPSA